MSEVENTNAGEAEVVVGGNLCPHDFSDPRAIAEMMIPGNGRVHMQMMDAWDREKITKGPQPPG